MENEETTPSAPKETFFDKFEKLTLVQRILIYAGSFVILVGAFVWLSLLPDWEKKSKLEKEYQEVEQKLAKSKKNASKLGMWRQKEKKARVKFNIARKALPEKEEIPSLLSSISQSGKDTGLDFLLFQPKAEKPKDFYAEIPVAINVTGEYHNVALFFDKVADLPRIVNISDIKMVGAKSNLLKTTCTATTYKFLDASGKKKKSKKKRRKK